jgi:LysR family transcriptional regulator, transcriptional activator of the cysJI operon
MGLELIERHGRRIVLTYAGHVLLGYARRMFALERDLQEAMAVLRDVEIGEINLAAHRTTGVYVLPPMVFRYRNLYPKVLLNITILNSHEIIEQTLNWTLDFGLVEGDPDTLPQELHVKVFAQDELMLVVSPEHSWSKLNEIHPEALREGQLVLREQGSGIREVIMHSLALLGVQVQPLYTLPDNEAIKQMVISGVGAAIVSALTIQRELVSGDLVRIPIAGIELHPQLSLVYRIDKHLSPAARAFCSLLETTNAIS